MSQKKVKHSSFTIFLCLLLWLCTGMSGMAEEFGGQLYARCAVLMDADSGRILYGKEEHTKRPMASTTKIMTCILVLEHSELDVLAEASALAARQPKVRLGVQEGEKFYVRDLLYSLMLESHNDSAVVLAETVGGSVEGFAQMMNEKARELDCGDTHFVTPNGLDGADAQGAHETTAADLARIMRYCITESGKSAEFLKITGTRQYGFQNAEGSRSFSCSNHNAFLDMMSGAISGKTGFTGEAGYCYVGALTREGKTFIVALLACGWPGNKSYKWADTKALMEYGISQYSYRNLWEEPQLNKIAVEGGIPQDGALSGTSLAGVRVEQAPEEWKYLMREDEQASLQVEMEAQIRAPVSAGTKAGTVSCVLNGESIATWSILVDETVGKRDFAWCVERIFRLYGLDKKDQEK